MARVGVIAVSVLLQVLRPGPETVATSRFVKFVCPEYPRTLQMAHVEDVVVIELKIDKRGVREEIHAVKGHPLLASAAIAAAKDWRFKPYLLNGSPVEVSIRVRLNFRLNGDPHHRCTMQPPQAAPAGAITDRILVE